MFGIRDDRLRSNNRNTFRSAVISYILHEITSLSLGDLLRDSAVSRRARDRGHPTAAAHWWIGVGYFLIGYHKM